MLTSKSWSVMRAFRYSQVLPPQLQCVMCRTIQHWESQSRRPRPDYFRICNSNFQNTRQFASNKKSITYEVEDVGDATEQHEPQPTSGKRGERMKVKFNWKNSLVTTDSLNLLESLYQTHPQLVELDESILLQYLERMSSYSIDVERAAEMALIYPQILSTTDERINSCVTALRSIGLTENQRKSVLRRAPQLVDIPSKSIAKHFTFLKTYLSTTETLDVLVKSVDVFLQKEPILAKKLDFLIKSMSHETKNIVDCKALSYSLKHMKLRHEFLIRGGLFKPIPYSKLIKVLEKDYKDKSKPRAKYFKPIEVVCYNDEDFLKTCTNNLLTLNELAAFEELYESEMLAKEEEEEEDDDDEDEDDGLGSDAVSLIKATNSVGIFNELESRSCYF